MGDRPNICLQYEDGKRIFLYSHWGGSEMPATLQDGLRRGQPRWTDESYLARILFCEMIRGDVLGETGYGIGSYPPDNEYPLLLVDPAKKEVRVIPYYSHMWKEGVDASYGWEEPLRVFSFEEYCNLPEADWKACSNPDYADEATA
jgi:hypothetical protein